MVTFSGAGLSAESGIATFRDPDGIWARFDPSVYASQAGFNAQPAHVVEWYNGRRRAVAAAAPNAAHRALANSRATAHITQNIDSLLESAGADPVIHLHGLIGWDRCNAACGYREAIDSSDPPPLRTCPECGELLRPDVVWFGEPLSPQIWVAAESAVVAADLVLVAGTSAEVWPAAGLVELAHDVGAAIVVVNTEATPVSRISDVELLGKAGEIIPRLFDEDYGMS